MNADGMEMPPIPIASTSRTKNCKLMQSAPARVDRGNVDPAHDGSFQPERS
jgi:hypothetical protein